MSIVHQSQLLKFPVQNVPSSAEQGKKGAHKKELIQAISEPNLHENLKTRSCYTTYMYQYVCFCQKIGNNGHSAGHWDRRHATGKMRREKGDRR